MWLHSMISVQRDRREKQWLTWHDCSSCRTQDWRQGDGRPYQHMQRSRQRGKRFLKTRMHEKLRKARREKWKTQRDFWAAQAACHAHATCEFHDNDTCVWQYERQLNAWMRKPKNCGEKEKASTRRHMPHVLSSFLSVFSYTGLAVLSACCVRKLLVQCHTIIVLSRIPTLVQLCVPLFSVFSSVFIYMLSLSALVLCKPFLSVLTFFVLHSRLSSRDPPSIFSYFPGICFSLVSLHHIISLFLSIALPFFLGRFLTSACIMASFLAWLLSRFLHSFFRFDWHVRKEASFAC